MAKSYEKVSFHNNLSKRFKKVYTVGLSQPEFHSLHLCCYMLQNRTFSENTVSVFSIKHWLNSFIGYGILYKKDYHNFHLLQIPTKVLYRLVKNKLTINRQKIRALEETHIEGRKRKRKVTRIMKMSVQREVFYRRKRRKNGKDQKIQIFYR